MTLLPALRVRPGQVGGVRHRGAEARRAGHGAIAAGQAARGNLVPAPGVMTVRHQLAQADRIKVASHPVRGRCHRRPGPSHGVVVGALAVQPGHDVRAPGRADVDQEPVSAFVEQFGQRQVKSGPGTGAGAHRRAEAGLAGLRAVHRDDERAVAAGRVPRARLAEHAVLDRDSVQVTRVDAQERVPGRLVVIGTDVEPVRRARGRPQPLPRRMQEALPALRPRGVPEDGGVGAAAQPVPAGCQRYSPAEGQFRR